MIKNKIILWLMRRWGFNPSMTPMPVAMQVYLVDGTVLEFEESVHFFRIQVHSKPAIQVFIYHDEMQTKLKEGFVIYRKDIKYIRYIYLEDDSEDKGEDLVL